MVRRINLFGGPGISKSTTAARLFSEFKSNTTRKVELVTEYPKSWAYIDRPAVGWDQYYVFAKQLHLEALPLQNGVETIITDSPLILNYAYSKANDLILQACQRFETEFPSLNIVLIREKPYVPLGRWESEDEAIWRDKEIEDELKYHNIPYMKLKSESVTAEALAKYL